MDEGATGEGGQDIGREEREDLGGDPEIADDTEGFPEKEIFGSGVIEFYIYPTLAAKPSENYLENADKLEDTESPPLDVNDLSPINPEEQPVHEARRDWFLIGAGIFAGFLILIVTVVQVFADPAVSEEVVDVIVPLITLILGIVARDYVQR